MCIMCAMGEPMLCTRCGSTKVIPDAVIACREIGVERDPFAVFDKHLRNVDLHNRVCCSCGYVEFFAEGLDFLWDLHLKAEEDRAQRRANHAKTREATAAAKAAKSDEQGRIPRHDDPFERGS